MLKFKKGEYFSDGEEVALGTTYIAHVVGWTKCWIKFKGCVVQDRKVYRVIRNEIPTARENLDDRNEDAWEEGIDGRPADPWVLQDLLPMEGDDGEVRIFVTSSYGGKRTISDLSAAWARRAAKGNNEQPIIKLRTIKMPTKKFGDVPRPHFEIVDWNFGGPEVREVPTDNLKQTKEFDDEIPF